MIGLPVFASTLAATLPDRLQEFLPRSGSPPGMSDGPKRAPSSPPDTPEPMKRRPFSFSAFSRRMVSVQSALPPSMMMSPGSKSGGEAVDHGVGRLAGLDEDDGLARA
jgi:hypothetical protein